MKITKILFIVFNLSFIKISYTQTNKDNNEFGIAVHGGAGSYIRNEISLLKEIEIKNGVLAALKSGYNILKQNGNHLDAVKAAIIEFENNPLFNAGKGGKITENFEVELDASIMDGSNLKCGAVGSVKTVKNPIKAAELVMNETPHILLVSESADNFAKQKNLEIVENTYFLTKERIDEWVKEHDKRKKTSLSDNSISEYNNSNDTFLNPRYAIYDFLFDKKFSSSQNIEYIKHNFKDIDLKGTTGAVALDKNGHLAAATSTGGLNYKMSGRIGDSPLIGSGNYANDKSVAVSCTGTGEEMIRRSTAFDVHARKVYKNISLKEVCDEVMKEFLPDTGGFIAIDKDGNIEMPFNSSGMARGYVKGDGIAYVEIFRGEDYTPTLYDLEKIK